MPLRGYICKQTLFLNERIGEIFIISFILVLAIILCEFIIEKKKQKKKNNRKQKQFVLK